MSTFTANKTSARLLFDYAEVKFGQKGEDGDLKNEKRLLMISDLYIKARSYAILNKVTFWLAVIAGIMVLVWPSLAVVMKDLGLDKEFLKSAIVQTTVTGLAALMFTIYSHYKKRQMHVENLMRFVIYSDDQTIESILERVVKEMGRIDAGFGFSDFVAKKDKEKG